MVGWHHQLDRQEFDQAPGVGDTHGSLVRCSSWGCKESDMTERLNSTECDFYHNLKKKFTLTVSVYLRLIFSIPSNSTQFWG